MPPRKLDRSSPKPPEKSLRRRAKKDTPVLRTPTLLKLKIPKQILPKTTTETLNIDNIAIKANEDGCQQKSSIKSKVNENIPDLEVGKEKKTIKKKKQVLQKKKRVLKKKIPDKTIVSGNIVEPVKKRRTKATETDNDIVLKKGVTEENQNLFNIPELNKNYIKVMMANEVVNLQFQKKPILLDDIENTKILQGTKLTARKKQIVNRKQKLKNNQENAEAAATGGDPAKRKVIRRITTRKCTDAINEVEVKPMSTIKKRSKGNENINSVSTFQPVRRNRRLCLNRKISKAGPVLQTNLNEIVKENISITCLNNDTLKSNVTTDKKELIFGIDQIDETASVASTDNSWTRDISSSSATSLITVEQEDFILIDNKLPILQLTHVDSEFKKNKNTIDIINNDHEEIGPQNRVANCAMFKANDVIETDPPNTLLANTEIKVNERLGPSNIISNGHVAEYTNKFAVNETDIKCIPLNHEISTTSNSKSGSNSTPGSTLSQSTSNKRSGTSRNNIVHRTDKNSPNIEFANDISVPGPSSVACMSTANTNFDQTEISSLSNDMSNINTNIQKLSLNIKKFCLDKIQFSQIGNKHLHDNTKADSRIKSLQDKIFTEEICKHEKNMIRLGLRVIQLLANDLEEGEIEEIEDNCNNINFQESTCNSSSNHTQTFNDGENISNNNEVKVNESPKRIAKNLQVELQGTHEKLVSTGDKFNKDNVSSNKLNHTFVDHDDDDALSLFAESITAIESCRKSSINNIGLEMPDREEYIPRPLFKNTIKPINYRPTKITNENIVDKNHSKMDEERNVPSKLVFDESINKNLQSNLFYEDRLGNNLENSVQISNTVNRNQMSTTPRLMASIYKPLKGKSYVFSGTCYFNLKATCKNRNCKYSHVYKNVNEVQNKLIQLSEKLFIQEYMRMRSWKKLRRLYGLCFVKECIRRNLTRILVEMAIDFLKNNNNSIAEDTIKLDIIDCILMYLNEVDLSTCDDLLRCSIQPGERALLCDTFISIIAKSQNFSRFKPIFIKLSQFMHAIGRTFSVEIAESILERICILPYEEMLVRALLLITRNSNMSIFSNKHIDNLERQLQMYNNELYQELKNLKEQALRCLPVLGNYYTPSSPLTNDHNGMKINLPQDNYETQSPDLPDVAEAISPRVRHVHVGDNDQNKTKFEITFSRNVNVDNFQRKIANDAKTNSEDTNNVKNRFNKWNHRSIFDNLRFQNQNRILSQPRFRMPFKRPCTDQGFEGSPAKFHRNSGPSNY